VRNESQLLLTAPVAPEPVTGTAVAASSSTAAVPDNPFWWTAVSRAQMLGYTRKLKSEQESSLGVAVSNACKKQTGMRPAELNNGKKPQQSASGIARATNSFTEAQAREWADDAINAWFNA